MPIDTQARGEETEDAKATGTTGRRKRDGVVYTPDYIARFIVAETLGAHLEEAFTEILRAHAKAGADLSDYAAIQWRRKSAELEAWQAYRDRLKTLRIVDPACGSGVFLIMAFDFLKAELGRVTLQTALTRRIPDLCPPGRDPKLTTRLQEWWTLPNFAAFRAEVKKVFKADVPLAERSAWEDWITRDRAEIARLSVEITKTEAQIDSIVYGLFDLTPDEIALLESVV